MHLDLNEFDGVTPRNAQELKRAKGADLITLADDVDGTRCSNCEYVRGAKKVDGVIVGFCVHPEVDQPVSERNCCAFWDRPGCIRPWKKK